jgi:hypothetical protein
MDWPRPDTNDIDTYVERNLQWYKTWLSKTGKKQKAGKTEL